MKSPFAVALLVLAVLAAYANSLSGPFVFDDVDAIMRNPSLRRLTSLDVLSPPPGLTVSGRPVVNLSLAVNHALGGEAVRGYHLVNVAIHAFAAVVLFALLRATWVRLHGDAAGAVGPAFGAALLWALHPLQTESVTYVVQRAESLMALFYLLTLYCFVRSIDAVRPRAWGAAAVVACALGMATKEVMVTAPLVALLYDRVFIAGSFSAAWRVRWRPHAGLAATWLVLAVSVSQAGDRAGTAGFSSGVTPWDYALTQCRAIIHYLRLVVWPHPLVFDYGPYEPSAFATLLPFAVVLALLLVGTVWLWRRQPAAGFAAVVFFLMLAPTSSVLPIPTEPMAEHRMYLPLAALAALAVFALHARAKTWVTPLIAVAALALGWATFLRNTDYRTERALWTATVEHAPANPRAHSGLAWALLADKDPTGAEARFTQALALRPTYLDARHGLARILDEGDRLREAEAQYRTILQTAPANFVALNALGMVYYRLGDLPAAAVQFEKAVQADPNSAPAHNNLGCVRFELGDFAAAQAHEETALRLNPDYAEAHYNLGNALARANHPREAAASYERALRLAPDYVQAHVNLGAVLQNLGDREAAVSHYQAALRLQPDYAFARKNLDLLLATPGSR